MNLKLFVSVLIVLTFHFQMIGQDTIKPLQLVKELSAVTITVNSQENKDQISQKYSRLDILKYQPQDVGAILQKVSGTTLKSYGGLGGMKTISVRGLGGQHTSVVLDGFLLNNAQNGQLNLATIQTDNIENLSLTVGGRTNYLLPASAYTTGSILNVSTFENSFDTSSFQVRFNSKLGSFGELDHYLSLKGIKNKWLIGAFGKYRQANGKYPYSFQNGNSITNGVRSNNDFKDWYSGLNLAYQFSSKTILRINFNNFGADQGLPGAVVFYNYFSNQRLNLVNNALNLNLNTCFNRFTFRFFGSYLSDYTKYTDPSYLNSIGGLTARYSNQTSQIGTSFYRLISSKMILFGGIDSKYSELKFLEVNNALPKRIHSTFLIGSTFNFSKIKSEIQLTGQSILENNQLGERAANQNKVNPFILIENQEFGNWKLKFNAWYKNSFRIPTFNELYYNGIGNVKLKPEEANQFSFGINFQPKIKKINSKVILNTYYTTVKNQILAIPTKNLFVWSMQNIGEVHTTGFEVRMDLGFQLNEINRLDLSGNYTFQQSLDFSDIESPTYKNQVAYIPKHTGNATLTYSRKNSGITISMFNSALRYSLNENISSNIIDGFAIFDTGIYSKINLAKKHDLRIQLTLKNMFNSSYAFVKYYVMPGRSFLISINYALR
jgi:outer membrane cobalamin receptor